MVLIRKIGLWVASAILWLTGNRSYLRVLTNAPLILSRRLLISTDPIDQSEYEPLPGSEWLAWNRG